ncbi:MAG: hypothetical protein U5N21_12490 [Rhodococcus sp. (in: high G+C Gram-positive bacteria)]|nr:hypothetical protein [Rhodococcus sp. (in: high G+C Gram-positive bacteria)]
MSVHTGMRRIEVIEKRAGFDDGTDDVAAGVGIGLGGNFHVLFLPVG